MPMIYQVHIQDEASSFTTDFMIYPLTGLSLAHAAALAREVKRDLESTPGMEGSRLAVVGNDSRGRLHALAGVGLGFEVLTRNSGRCTLESRS